MFLNTDGRSYGLKVAIEDGLDVGAHPERLASKMLDSLVEARVAQRGGIYGGLAMIKSPAVYEARRDWDIQHEREYWADVRERDAATADAALARREVEHIRVNLATLKPPKEMWWGLGILVFFAVIAVIAPLAVLACYPTIPRAWMTAVSLGGFGIGFTVTVAYMAIAMRSLSPPTPAHDEGSRQTR